MLPPTRFSAVVIATALFGLALEYAHWALFPFYWIYKLVRDARNW